MRKLTRIRDGYTRSERVSDGVVHVLGVVLAVIAVPVLIVLTVQFRSQKTAIVGASIYGATLVLMLAISALYNMSGQTRWTGLLQRLDHSAIYLKIAGTYTPFLLLSGVHMPRLLVGLWAAAVAGTLLKVLMFGRFRWFTLALYLAMGWAVLFVGMGMLSELPGLVLGLMTAGGIIYTVGVVFYLSERLPFHITIWHVHVLAGSVLFFIAVSLLIVGSAADAHTPAQRAALTRAARYQQAPVMFRLVHGHRNGSATVARGAG